VYFGIRIAGQQWLAVILIGVFAARFVILRRNKHRNRLGSSLHLLAAAGIVLAITSIVAESPNAMLYYPVIANLLLLYVFVFSLFRPPTVIEFFARIQEKNLEPSAVAYTRRATIAWAIFFAVNGSISLFTVLGASLETWAVYNGLVSYILIGCMFLMEFFIRSRYRFRNSK
jgi:uncharacterized membrane protein